MNNLYLLQGTTSVLRVGKPIKGLSNSDNKFPPFTFPKPGDAYNEIQALLTSQALAKWVLIHDDGPAPTAAAGSFVLPAAREWHPFAGRVKDITERQTDTGPQVTLHIEPNVI